MKSVLEMSVEEAREEAKRRAECRARGLSFEETPAERERIREAEDGRLEKEIQQACRRIWLAHGCIVYHLSQSRSSKQTPGIGDDFVLHPRLGLAWWAEYKTPRGKQSPDQIEFQQMLSTTAVGYVLGGESAAWAHLRTIGACE